MFEEDKQCEAYVVGEKSTNNDVETKLAMGKLVVYGGVESCSPLVLETWALVSGNQCDSQETKGGGEEVKVETSMYNKEAEQSTTKDDEGQAVWVDSKGVPWEVITTSKVKEDTSVKI